MSWDSTWEEVFSKREWGKYPGEDLIRFVARNFYSAKDRSSIKLLEVGSGTGANLWYMAREGFQVYGVEASPTAADISRTRLTEEIPGWQGEIIVADIDNLPYEDSFFDGVIDIEALSCNRYEDSKQIYSEILRVLKPSGKLYSRCFACGTVGEKEGKADSFRTVIPEHGPLANGHIVRFTAEEDIGELLDGYDIVDIDMMVPSMKPETMVREWTILAAKP